MLRATMLRANALLTLTRAAEKRRLPFGYVLASTSAEASIRAGSQRLVHVLVTHARDPGLEYRPANSVELGGTYV